MTQPCPSALGQSKPYHKLHHSHQHRIWPVCLLLLSLTSPPDSLLNVGFICSPLPAHCSSNRLTKGWGSGLHLPSQPFPSHCFLNVPPQSPLSSKSSVACAVLVTMFEFVHPFVCLDVETKGGHQVSFLHYTPPFFLSKGFSLSLKHIN